MHALASYLLRGKITAAITACGFAVLALLLPPLTWPAAYFSCAALALVLLEKGPVQGFQTAIIAVAVILVLTSMAAKAVGLGLIFAIVLWLPVLMVAELLRHYRSLALALTGVLILAMVMLIGVYLSVDDPAQWWRQHLQQEVIPLLEQAGVQNMTMFQDPAVIDAIAAMMTGSLAALWVFGTSVSLLLARWWQSLVTRPGAFAMEFYQLRYGTVVAGVGVMLTISAYILSGTAAQLASNLSLIFLAGFLFQGLAVMHQRLGRQKNAKLWLTVMYVLMVLTLPYLLIIIAAVGWLDNWVNLRGRSPSAGNSA